MTITITKISDREVPEHWRILIIKNDKKILHTSATTEENAIIENY